MPGTLWLPAIFRTPITGWDVQGLRKRPAWLGGSDSGRPFTGSQALTAPVAGMCAVHAGVMAPAPISGLLLMVALTTIDADWA